IAMLMTAHVVYPALDPDRPASLSAPIITELLRRQLGFDGVVVSDDLEMGAIVRHGSVEQAAVQALVAGTDLLLVCHSPQRAIQARDACLQALTAGRLSARAQSCGAQDQLQATPVRLC
ncbi:MAG: glycoside hydrolase family 3 protein, partial [Desulfurellaceae bacterium]|nr:glycoside hydrolase family 3 protein [Desulfurellaceae bacterium]